MLRCIPDVRVDDEGSWVELPDVATTPCVDAYQTLEDMDVFAEEWPENDMWRLDDADVCLDSQGFDDQSDESLIGGSISLASITMHSPQAGVVALYHHQYVDNDGLDPAGSGLCYTVSQLGDGTSAVLASSPSHELHDPYYSERGEQVMGNVGTSGEGFDRTLWDGYDSDTILFALDDVADEEEEELLV